MGEAVKIAAKTPAANKKNKATKTQKSEFSQSTSSPVDQIRFLQRTIGNQAIGRLINSGSACPKSTDRRLPEEEEFLQPKEVPGSTSEVTPGLEASINSIRGGGQPLPESVRAFYEPRLGHDLSGVRVHTDTKAAKAARAVDAQAFTVGKDVVFGAEEYTPGTDKGRRLLAHELVHVVQQKGGAPNINGPNSPAGSRDAQVVARSESDVSIQRAPAVSTGSSEPGISGQGGAPEAEKGREYVGIVNGKIVVLSEKEFQSRMENLKKTMRSMIRKGISDAETGKETQRYHMEEVRGVAGLISDWLNDVYPPYIGMWNFPKQLLMVAGERLENDDLRGAQIYLASGYESLREAQSKWKSYMKATIEGAEETVATLETIRDGAIAVEVGLLTGGTIYAAGGGGALVTAGATLAGAGATIETAATMESPLGEAVRGTLDEVKAQGLVGNLKLAAHGIAGIIYGIGEGLTAIGTALLTLFTNPKQFLEDLLKLPAIIEQLWEHRRELWVYFQRLPPEEQAFQVGRFTGHLEAFLITIQTGRAAGNILSEGVELTVPSMALVPAADGSALIVMTGRVVAIKSEAGALVFSTGATVAAPGAFAMGMEGVESLLGEGPETRGMHETGAKGAGISRPPRHHVFPKEFRAWFEERGFKGARDIDNFTVELEEAVHQAIHGGGNWKLGRTWPDEWNNMIMRELVQTEKLMNRKMNFDEIMTVVREFMVEYRIEKPFLPYR